MIERCSSCRQSPRAKGLASSSYTGQGDPTDLLRRDAKVGTIVEVHTPTLALFVLASFVLAVTPGPGVLFLITRTLSQGRSAGLASISGLAVGAFGNLLCASLGLAVLFAVSTLAFTVVKLAGAA